MLLAGGLTDINYALSFWTIVTFSILLVVLGKFAWGPILQMIATAAQPAPAQGTQSTALEQPALQ